MRPGKKNYDFLVSELKSFGFKYKKTNRSLLEIDKEKVKITEVTSTYNRADELINITRIQVIDKPNDKEQDIGLYLSISTSESTKEIFEIQEFFEYFRDEIRDVKISKIIG